MDINYFDKQTKALSVLLSYPMFGISHRGYYYTACYKFAHAFEGQLEESDTGHPYRAPSPAGPISNCTHITERELPSLHIIHKRHTSNLSSIQA